jgi:hypothetical protein
MVRKRFAILSALSLVGALAGFFLTSAKPAMAVCYRSNYVATGCGGCMASRGTTYCLNNYGSCMPIMDECPPRPIVSGW